MSIENYFDSISEELQRRSERIRLGFSTHRLSAGENRESILAEFLESSLPKAYAIDSGLVLSKSGEFSNQADLLIVDQQNNAPLYPAEAKRLWLVEAVYGMIEVKSSLSPSDIADAVAKGRRFKHLPREFADLPASPRIRESLFVIWAWTAPSPETLKQNLVECLRDLPREEHPDFVVVPGSVVVTAGQYRELARLGHPGTKRRIAFDNRHGGAEQAEAYWAANPVEVLQLNENSILGWLIWLLSWLRGAGVRTAPLQAYLDRTKVFGSEV